MYIETLNIVKERVLELCAKIPSLPHGGKAHRMASIWLIDNIIWGCILEGRRANDHIYDLRYQLLNPSWKDHLITKDFIESFK